MTRTSHLKTIGLVLIAGALLSGCGLRGKLKTPPPIWGEDTTTDAPQTPDNPDQGG